MMKETNQITMDELEVEEVNVYSSGCGTTKLHCIVDCEVTHNCWITCDQ